MELRQRERLLALGAVICVLLLAGDKMIVSPLRTVWKERQARIAQLEESLAKGRALVGREETLRQRWLDMQKRCLPASVSEAENLALKSVDRWARGSRLSMTTLSPRRTEKEEDFTKLELRAKAKGTMEAIARFLYDLENDPLALRVEEIEIAGFESTSGDLTLDIRFSGLLPASAAP
ncbi:MAG TPA: GspMb/PilO family protein [Sumerlaeia bacterium]|nr:GspMb/PilO family protein [Sumerlaeia bacterium]